ncbi:hypothetical protein [Sciscionella marina]|uniref:hypothetical protein n=1 Tax=Sciscionella marina TaxID=508770 RepID=UPI0003663623|nr:hypothetical protein [Sciscionella marina]
MWKRTIATAALTALTFGTFGAVGAATASAQEQPANPVAVVQPAADQAHSLQDKARALLGKLEAVKLPANSPKQAQLDAARSMLNSVIEQPKVAAGNPLCDVVNTVLNTAYELMLKIGIPNGPDIGLPDFPNPCRGM